MLGMTETGSVCLTSEDESPQPERRRGSFGRPAPGFEATVRRSDGDGDGDSDGDGDGDVDEDSDEDSRGECGPGEVGELWFRGPFLMEGYDGREHGETFDEDGWYHTGDLVRVDEEGFFYFRGRSSDLIKTAGANVSPREVEAAILQVSGVLAHVVGINDESRGQLVAALLRAPAGAGTHAIDVADLRERLRERLSAYKVPKRFIVLPDVEVPMMSSGKLDLRAVKELFDAP
jgi:acyl-CoA synthetase (AMP-forming)/AMP-acid ligase II